MGCFSTRRSGQEYEIDEQQKWDYITLSDFKSKSCGTFLSYCWLWILVFVTIAVYGADTFTAYRLIRLGKWTNDFAPPINVDIAKWIFVGCIGMSWALALYSWIRALRVMRKGSVTEDYLDPMAVTLQSIRFGSGWQRFLVFAALTKSKRKVSIIALFVYFQRKDAIRLLTADGPRQAINALTIWSLAKSKLLNTDGSATGFDKFFNNLKALGGNNPEQKVIIYTMMFTLIIWAMYMLFLIVAFFLYLFFLVGFIKNTTLTGFCRQKVETRLARIVKAKTDKVWAKQAAKYEKMARKASPTSLSSTPPPKLDRAPTLPTIIGSLPAGSSASQLTRGDSTSTVPLFSSHPNNSYDTSSPTLGRHPSLPNIMNGRPMPPSRSATGYSTASFESDTPLMSRVESVGYSDPHLPPMERSFTGGSTRSFTPISSEGRGGPTLPPLLTQQSGPRFPPSSRTNTGFSTQTRSSPLSAGTSNYNSPASAQSNYSLVSPPSRRDRNDYRQQGTSYEMTPVDQQNHQQGYFPPQAQQYGSDGRNSPAALQFPASLQMLRRDMSAPMPQRAPALPGQPTWSAARNATAPVLGHGREPSDRNYIVDPGYWTERSQTAGSRGW